jgi:hypothetical protein
MLYGGRRPSMNHSPLSIARMCSSIFRMSSKEDVLAVPPSRCPYLYGLTKAAGSLSIFCLRLRQSHRPSDRKERIWICLWLGCRVHSSDGCIDTVLARERDIRSVARMTLFFQSANRFSFHSAPVYLIPFPTFHPEWHGRRGSELNYTLIQIDACK